MKSRELPTHFRLPWPVLALVLSSGCEQQDQLALDHRGIVKAALEEEAQGARATNVPIPCVMPIMYKLGDNTDRLNLSNSIDLNRRNKLPQSWLPTSMSFCTARSGQSYLSVYEPDQLRDEAGIDIDMHCGALCGSGQTYILHRKDGAWHVVGREPGWVS